MPTMPRHAGSGLVQPLMPTGQRCGGGALIALLLQFARAPECICKRRNLRCQNRNNAWMWSGSTQLDLVTNSAALSE